MLGGLCGALLAAGLSPYDAGPVGSWLHGAAATLASAGGPISAPDVAAALPRVIAALLRLTPGSRERDGRMNAMSREQVRRPEIVVDLGAIRRNVGRLRDLVAPDGSDVMVVVKADGYGHGMLESAARRAAGGGALARRRHDRRGAAAARGR